MTTTSPLSPTPHPIDALVLSGLPEATRERAAAVRLLALDVDGVLTDGSLIYGEQGEALKRFNVLDGYGLQMLRDTGILVALITGRKGLILERRAADLGISIVLQGVRDKYSALQELAREHSLLLSQTAFMGDDLIDVPAMQRAGLAASVPNAPAYVRQAAHWVASLSGGHGAVREYCDLILAAQGKLGQRVQSGGAGAPVVQ